MIPASSVNAVLITHEHSDHIAGLEVFCRHYRTALYGTIETKRFMEARGMLVPGQQFNLFRSGEELTVGDLKVVPFATPHDSQTCHGFSFSKGMARLSVATDLGQMTEQLPGLPLYSVEKRIIAFPV